MNDGLFFATFSIIFVSINVLSLDALPFVVILIGGVTGFSWDSSVFLTSGPSGAEDMKQPPF